MRHALGLAVTVGMLFGCADSLGGPGPRRAPVDDDALDEEGTLAVSTMTLQVAGMERTALVHAPPGATALRPAVIAFHGGKVSNRASRMVARWEHLAGDDIVMAFPNGISTAERAWAGPEDQRDFLFIDALIDRLVEEHGVDRRRVYAAGFSNGSGMTWMLECFRAERFAGFGHVQQSLAREVLERCQPAAHVPFLWVHGDADPRAPWDTGRATIGVTATLEYWLPFHGCSAEPVSTEPLPPVPGDPTSAIRMRYACDKVPGLEVIRVVGGSHHYPTGARGRRADGRSTVVDASAELLRFWGLRPAP